MFGGMENTGLPVNHPPDVALRNTVKLNQAGSGLTKATDCALSINVAGAALDLTPVSRLTPMAPDSVTGGGNVNALAHRGKRELSRELLRR